MIKNRLTGFTAPFDVDATIQKLMKAERASRDKLEQKQISNRYVRDDYLAINTQLLALQKKASNLKLQSNINKLNASVTGNTATVSATVTTGAIGGSYTVAVNQVATSASVTSDKFISDPVGFNETASLKSQASKMSIGAVASNGTTSADYEFKINGVLIKVDTDNDSMNSVISAINNSAAGVTAVFDKTSGKINLQSKTAGYTNGETKDQKDISLTDVTGDFLKNVVKVTSDNTGTVQNSAQNASITVNGITMTGNTNDFTINGVKITATKETGGSPAVVTVKRDVDAMMETIKDFIKVYNESLSLMNTKYSEKHNRNYTPLTAEQRANLKDSEIELWDAEAKKGLLKHDPLLSGARVELRSSQTNKYAYDTASIESDYILSGNAKLDMTASLASQQSKLKGTVLSNGSTASDYEIKINGVSISIDSDNDSMSAIMSKINNSGAGVTAQYNQSTGKLSLISNNPGSVNGATHDQPNISIQDVTGDFSTLMQLSTTGAVNTASTDSKYLTLGSIGISTTGWKDNGILTVDDTKLREALEKDPDAVIKMFTNNSTIKEQKGFAFRVYDTVTDYMNKIKEKAGTKSTDADDTSILGAQLKEINRKLIDMDKLLEKKEDRYYQMFSVMESNINRYQSQSSVFNQ